MPSIVGPARYMRPHKRLKTNPETPLNRAVAGRPERYVGGRRDRPDRPEAVPPPEFGAAPMSPSPTDLAWQWERARILLAADRFARLVLSAHVAAGVWPDSAMVWFDNAFAWVELELTARLTWPDLYAAEGDDPAADEGEDVWRPRTDADALAAGMVVRRPDRHRVRPPANLPGCEGKADDGSACNCFRVKGRRYCPHHEKLIRQSIRAQGG